MLSFRSTTAVFVRSGIVLAALAVTAPAYASVRYVKAARPDDSGDGLSWAAAERTLQAALQAAVTGDEIWVAAGTYKPDQGGGQTLGDRSASFQLRSGVVIYGGFAGTETQLSQRNPSTNAATLSGDLSGDDVDVPCTRDSPDCDSFGRLCVGSICIIKGNNTENSFHVVTGSGTDVTGVIDGVIIAGGNADGIDADAIGGGMYNVAGSPTVGKCTFSGNSAATDGGGMLNAGGSPAVSDCTFSGNSANNGRGGAMYNGSTRATVAKCTFSANSAFVGGGGMQNMGDISPMVTNCTFTGNTASHGGGMHNQTSRPTVTNCAFTDNSASAAGGGMVNNSSSNPMVTNCTFSGNLAHSFGGGMYISESTPTVTNCTFSGNSANSFGGGMYDDGDSSPTVCNSILWGNVDDADGDGGGPFMGESAQIHIASGTLAINYSIVKGWSGGLGGTGNAGNDPLLATDLRLGPGSPGINAGNNSCVTVLEDLAGNQRIVNCIVDVGAYEFASSPCSPQDPSCQDCNANGIPDECDTDTDGDGVPDACDQCPLDPTNTKVNGQCIPTLSEWGMIAMAALMLSAGGVVIKRRAMGNRH